MDAKRPLAFDLALGLAIVLILSSCRPILAQQVQSFSTTNTIVFFSERRTRVEYGVTAGQGIRNLLTAKSDGSGIAYLAGTFNAMGFYPITWMPGGSKFAALTFDQKTEQFCLMLYEADGQRCLIEDNDIGAPTWSPNGNWIAFFERTDSFSKRLLKAYKVDTGEIIVLTDLPDNRVASVSTWSPDSTRIAYDTGLEPTDLTWVRNLVDGEVAPLFSGHGPAWSPDGKEIAFVRSKKIWIYNIANKTEELFIDDPVEASWPTWSPDGQQLLFQSNRDGNWEVYSINRNRTGLLNISNDPAWDGLPSWRPEAK